LLYGYGAPGDDVVGLAYAFDGHRAALRFVSPAARLGRGSTCRATLARTSPT